MKIALLGSTGSIGTQTLDVCARYGYKVDCLSANKNEILLEAQCRRFMPRICCIGEDHYLSMKQRLADTDIKVVAGKDALCQVASESSCDTLVNALLGISGLEPTLAAIDGKKRIALANKETLVAGGELVMKRVKETHAELLPIDSEHSAIFQCIGDRQSEVESVILTASGGAFWGKKLGELKKVTAADALKHPNWNMGQKITVDCATMMNKGFEIIEAMYLFDLPSDRVEVIIHRQSVIHSMVRFVDGAVIAQLGTPDMHLPISFALSYPARLESPDKKALDLKDCASLTFAEPDNETFGLLQFARDAINRGGNIPAAMNGADEAAVELFLQGKIGFNDIEKLIRHACSKAEYTASPDLKQIIDTDIAAREAVKGCI